MQTSPNDSLGPDGIDHALRYRETRRITVIGGATNVILTIAKLVGGVVGHSQSLVADGVHSLTDLVGDFVVLWAARHTHRAADEDHPYGHGRIETVATVALSLLLLAIGVGIFIDAGSRLFHPDALLEPDALTLIIAVVAVGMKEVMYFYTLRVARALKSPMLHANAWHHRSDSISSVVVIIGVGGTLAGLEYLDAIAAVGVALMIAKAGWEFGWKALRELTDTALAPERIDHIQRVIGGISGVKHAHHLRTRTLAGSAFVDVHIQVGARLSVSEGHQIAEAVRKQLVQDIDEVCDVVVHIDAEDDENEAPCDNLPLRDEILGRLQARWAGLPGADCIKHTTLHYLSGKIHIDVVLPLDVAVTQQAARTLIVQYAQRVGDEPDIGRVGVSFG
ncbi:MAG: cation diffusion facilitator family transporter [Gammaproteobacteria bacterium]|nr:cation diffusion facilitator family transporter [Gammaproteobacteria bacterium]